MYYIFYAEFFENPTDATPKYSTRINGIEDAQMFISSNKFVRDTTSYEEDYILEVDSDLLETLIDTDKNPEILSILFEGDVCNRMRVIAYCLSDGEGTLLGCSFGHNDSIHIVFEGNKPEDSAIIWCKKQRITTSVKDLKTKLNTLTLSEVCTILETEYTNIDFNKFIRILA